MSLKYSNKINKIRTIALSLIFAGMIIMYIGLLFKNYEWVMVLFMFLGLIAIALSTVIYFWIGMLSTRAIQVVCPECEKPTKVLGRVDACMHCKQPLTLDRNLEGKEFDEKYNSKKYWKEQEKTND
ncbi:YgzB family protein [Tenuibacillus multivorans]|uniref:UPF0295 protein SAMN05216498_0384 n=1 Tax=Tenuibacillus multivorans TaxID=237069 RepID=A0A1H0FXS9_9BACI|nr:YgzB family protein [Tenuibacillus multivorans]GEL78172.1 UPF0295 protein [Tenuibacillus multivorans]SDN99289.1 Zinc-ribbon containing domain-containing protein [Tenuibacillus multivorans]